MVEHINNEQTRYTLQGSQGVPIKSWTVGVPFEEGAKIQVEQIASLPFIYKWVAIMPDVHQGKGAPVGSVIPTRQAVIPAAVGVDIGCGMMALKTSLRAASLPDNLQTIRAAIEKAVPHGRTDNGGRRDRGAWGELPPAQRKAWEELKPGYEAIIAKHPSLNRGTTAGHLGTLGTGNHFIEMCIDGEQFVWFMLHSGSRGVGNRIGNYFISLAQDNMKKWFITLPDADLAYFPEGTEQCSDYLAAVTWAQEYARVNRELMMEAVVQAVQASGLVPLFETGLERVNCHHNYITRENHYGANVWVTRKGAVRAAEGDLGIIPGSMGTSSYIVRGRGNPESFKSCSHGAGRAMSRTQAKLQFRVEDHIAATTGVECRKDADILDETPAAYKSIDAVMAAQRDLVDIVYTLKQVVCVKG